MHRHRLCCRGADRRPGRSQKPLPLSLRKGGRAARAQQKDRRAGDPVDHFKANLSSAQRHARVGLIGRIVVLGIILVLGSSTSWGQGARPAAKGAGSQTASLARYVPRQDLLFYLEFDGLDAHATAWRATAAYKLLNDTKLGALVEDLASQGIELAQQSVPPSKRIKGADVVGLLKNMVRQGFVFAAAGKVPNDTRAIMVIASRRPSRGSPPPRDDLLGQSGTR